MARKITPFTGLSLLLVLFLMELMLGASTIGPAEIWQMFNSPESAPESVRTIVLDFRLPKALSGLLSGFGLAVGGLLTQSLFRNPLTGPDILGLTSGAGLAVALLVLAGIPLVGLSLTSAAVTGSAATFLLILLIARKVRNNTLLVAGIMVSALAAALVSALQFFSGAENLQQYTIWSMGSITQTNMDGVAWLFLMVSIGFLLALGSAKGLDAIGLSDLYASSMGIRVSQLKWVILFSTAILAGTVTAFCGPISFIGIAAPHLAKQWTGSSRHRFLLPITGLTGSILVLGCDLLTLLPGKGTVLPLNAVTALVGAPVVLWVLLTNRHNA